VGDPNLHLQDEPPALNEVTDYDLCHGTIYLRLLDASADGADWTEAAEIVLGLDPRSDADRARRVHDSHLERARWMTRVGYRDLLARTS